MAKSSGSFAGPKDWLGLARDFWQALDIDRPDLTRAEAQPGRPRGIDVYSVSTFWPALAAALSIFHSAHERLPDLATLPSTVDHYFAMKFFMPIPISPNPASKLDAALLLGADKTIRVPRRFGIGRGLPPDSAAPPGRYWLKLDLGNAGHRRVQWPPSPEERSQLTRDIEMRVRSRYGVAWGEWWYGLGEQRVYLEEDLSEVIDEGYELKVVVRRGRPVWLMAMRYQVIAGTRTVFLRHFLPDGTEMFGETGYGLRGTVFSNQVELPPVQGREIALAAAARIGAQFDLVRVDFYMSHVSPPILGEVSLCQSNARLALRPASFDLAYRRQLFDPLPEADRIDRDGAI